MRRVLRSLAVSALAFAFTSGMRRVLTIVAAWGLCHEPRDSDGRSAAIADPAPRLAADLKATPASAEAVHWSRRRRLLDRAFASITDVSMRGVSWASWTCTSFWPFC